MPRKRLKQIAQVGKGSSGRIKWTNELRKILWKFYLDVDPGRYGYLSRLHERWCIAFPEYSTTKAGLATQIRICK